MHVRTLSNVVAVFASAALVGAMILIWLVLGRFWHSLAPAEFLDWFAANGPMVGRIMFAFAGVAACGFAASIWLDRSDRGARARWAGSLACLAVVLVITFVVEVPLNKAFETHALVTERVGAAIDEWLWWHVGRVVFGSGSAVLAILALVGRSTTTARSS